MSTNQTKHIAKIEVMAEIVTRCDDKHCHPVCSFYTYPDEESTRKPLVMFCSLFHAKPTLSTNPPRDGVTGRSYLRLQTCVDSTDDASGVLVTLGPGTRATAKWRA